MANNTIWKFPLVFGPGARYPVELPGTMSIGGYTKAPISTAKPLHVNFDVTGQLCLWVEVDREATEKETVIITVVGTGHELPEDAGYYMNTFTIDSYVFHAYYAFKEND